MTDEAPWVDQPILGIDLGTTYSAAAIWDGDAQQVVPIATSGGGHLLPSIVGWDPAAHDWLVGERAAALSIRRPGSAAYSIKRYIGRAFTDPQIRHGLRDLGYKLASGGGEDRLRDVIAEIGSDAEGPVRLTAPEVSAKVLEALRADAARALERAPEDLRYAVITVPAHFNVLQRKATRLAGEIAGFDVVDIVNEPSAAALACARDALGPEPRTILVYDLGGGTLDISLLEATEDATGYTFDTLVVHGDTHLGGDDVDVHVARWLGDALSSREGIAIRGDDRAAWEVLRRAAERAKVALSTEDAVEVPLEDVAEAPVSITLTRADLERCAEPVLRRAHDLTREAVEEIAGLSWDEIDEAILVGGQTLMPAIQRDVEQLTGRRPRLAEQPQLAVAAGAAEYAHMLSLGRARFQERALINVLALPLGVRLDENRFKPLVEANKTVPHRNDPPFPVTTTEDNQTRISVQILQGSRTAQTADDCVLLGTLEMEVPPAPAGIPRFDVVFDVKDDGTMKIVVSDARRDRSETLDIVESRPLIAWRDPTK